MTRVEANKAIARQAIEEIWDRRNQDAIDMLYAADYMARDIAPSINPGREGYKQWVSDALRTFPDAFLTLEEMVAHGDKVALRYTVRRSGQDTQMGTNPGGKQGAIVMRISEGRIRESWGATRIVHLLQRIHPIPSPPECIHAGHAAPARRRPL